MDRDKMIDLATATIDIIQIICNTGDECDFDINAMFVSIYERNMDILNAVTWTYHLSQFNKPPDTRYQKNLKNKFWKNLNFENLPYIIINHAWVKVISKGISLDFFSATNCIMIQ